MTKQESINEIIKEFKTMDKIPVIEIFSEGRQEYIDYWIYIDERKSTLWTRGENEVLTIDLDECFSLDEHLQSLYELIIDKENY